MIYWAILVHVAFGIALLINPGVSAAVILVGLHWLVRLGVEGPTLGIALLLAAGVALVSLVLDRRLSNRTALLLLMPQFALLVAAFISDVQSVVTGVLPDGRKVDELVLFVALCPMMFAALLHSFAIVERHSQWNKR